MSNLALKSPPASVGYMQAAAAAALAAGFVMESETVNVGGFAIQVGRKNERGYQTFRSEEAAVTKELGLLDIKPLAVIPTTWFDAIIKRGGLMDLGNVNKLKFNSAEMTAHVRGNGAIVIIGSTALVGAALGWFVGSMADNIWFGIALGVCVAALSTIMLAGLLFPFGLDRIIGHLLTSDAALIKKFAQPTSETAWERYSEHDRSRIVGFTLPTPPDDITSILLRAKVAGIQMGVAATPEAIKTRFPLSDVTKTEMKRQAAERRERRARLRADPIIYVKKGPATAIIAQFGEFPIEKQVIDDCIKTVRLG